MAATHDILQLKTEAELRFFVENPSFYQPELVAEARSELRRRGAGSTPATPHLPELGGASAGPAEYANARPTQPSWLVLGSVAAVFFLAALGFWVKSSRPHAAGIATRAASPPKAAPQLEAAPSSPIPTYDTEGYVEKALAQVPAAEKRNEQRLNQYRAVSRRFWAAQNPSAHLIERAQVGKANPVFGAQAQLVLALWHDFDRTQVYSYTFDPVMADHLARMKVVAQYQREALKELANDTEAQRPPHLDDARTLAHQQALPHLLAALAHKAGPLSVHL
jgi:hypothetical protein